MYQCERTTTVYESIDARPFIFNKNKFVINSVISLIATDALLDTALEV